MSTASVPPPSRRIGRRIGADTLAVLVVLVAGLLLPAAQARAADAAAEGWLRLAHLSPDTPAVDVYLSPFGSDDAIVLRSVGYGDYSDYRAVPAGTYSASMRPAGAPAGSAPVLRANARVAAGKAYTVAAVGLNADLTTKVLLDDLTPPPAGKGRIRLIQASTRADSVDVQAVGGPTLAQGTAFGTSTGYATVPAGRWTLQVTPAGGDARPLTTTVDVPAGRVSSVTILDSAGDGAGDGVLDLRTTVDSEGSATVPTGGVKTGFGPASTGTGTPVAWWGAVGACAVSLALAGWGRRRRSIVDRTTA